MIRGLLRISTWYHGGEVASLSAFCPACDFEHGFRVDLTGNGRWEGIPIWGFNGNYERPTFEGSMFANRDRQIEELHPSCHSFLTDGQWHYLKDCDHSLAGQVVPVPPPDPDMSFEKQHGWHLFPWCDSEGKPLFKSDGTPYNPPAETNLPIGIFKEKAMTAITTGWVEHRQGFLKPDTDIPLPFHRAGGKPVMTLHSQEMRLKVWMKAGAVPPSPLTINGVNLSDAVWISRARGGERYWESALDMATGARLMSPTPPESETEEVDMDADLLVEIQSKEIWIDAQTMYQAFAAHPRMGTMQVIGLDSRYKAVPQDLWDRIIDGTDVDACEYRTDEFDCDDFAVTFKGDCAKHFALGNAVGMVVDTNYSPEYGHAYVALLVVDGDTVRAMMVEPQNDRWGVGAQEGQQGSGFILI